MHIIDQGNESLLKDVRARWSQSFILTTEELADFNESAFLLADEIQNEPVMAIGENWNVSNLKGLIIVIVTIFQHIEPKSNNLSLRFSSLYSP